MPTSYTAKLYKEDGQSFQDFVLDCARSRGVLIHMGDQLFDKEIKLQEVSPWREQQIHLLENKLKVFEDLEYTKSLHRTEIEAAAIKNKEQRIRIARRRTRYQRMLAQVNDWQPPTEEHIDHKEFMIEQLETSIEHDCLQFSIFVEPDFDKWLEEERWMISSSLDQAKLALKKEQESIEERNKWILALAESIGISNSTSGEVASDC